jgi:glycosyltransferase involved in cell wall biosynthesis
VAGRSPLRVAHLVASLGVGGKERTVADLCSVAGAGGVQPVVVTFDPPATAAAIDVAPVNVLALDRRTGRRSLAAALADALRERDIDVLHAHGHVAAIYAADAKRRVAVPVVVSLHVDWRSDWRWALSIARALRRVDRVAAVSGDLARRYRPLAGRPIEVVPTGVDLRRFAAPGAPLQRRGAGAFTIGMAARFHPVKRHADVFAAVEVLTRRGQPIRLLVAGTPETTALRNAYPAADIRLLGALTDMPAFYASLDAFVLASDHEGTPLALLEAMASGVPCVATAVGGIPEIVRGPDGDCALLVPPRDPAALADAVAMLARQPALAADLARRALCRVQRYGLDAQAAAYARFYRSAAPTARAW